MIFDAGRTIGPDKLQTRWTMFFQNSSMRELIWALKTRVEAGASDHEIKEFLRPMANPKQIPSGVTEAGRRARWKARHVQYLASRFLEMVASGRLDQALERQIPELKEGR